VNRWGLSGRRVHSATHRQPTQACSAAWRRPQSQTYGLPQQRRYQLSPGPGSYNTAVSGPFTGHSYRWIDFKSGSPRPGSAPPLLHSKELGKVRCGDASDQHTGLDRSGSDAVSHVPPHSAGFPGIHVPSSRSRPRVDVINESQGQ
jgi:hypothetical protein